MFTNPDVYLCEGKGQLVGGEGGFEQFLGHVHQPYLVVILDAHVMAAV